MIREQAISLLANYNADGGTSLRLLKEGGGDVDQRYSRDAEMRFVVQYLDFYGYFKAALDTLAEIELGDIIAALKLFQTLFGLKDTGSPDPATLKVMEKSRCGAPDAHEDSNDSYRRVRAFGVNNKQRWQKRGLKYYVERYVSGVPRKTQDSIFAEGFWQWCRHGNIEALRTGNKREADILVSTGAGPRSNFDGPGGTLAWAFLPDGSDKQLVMRFDESEQWIAKPGKMGTLLPNVLKHEIGHLFGLDHSYAKGSLMAPYYDAHHANPGDPDVQTFQAIYGERKEPLPPPEGVKLTASATKRSRQPLVVITGGSLEIYGDGEVQVKMKE